MFDLEDKNKKKKNAFSERDLTVVYNQSLTFLQNSLYIISCCDL